MVPAVRSHSSMNSFKGRRTKHENRKEKGFGNHKKVISILLFFVILLYSISKVGQFARPDESDAEAWAEYYAEEKDTVNVLMIGSSAIFRYWNPPQAYEEQDFTSAMLASSIQDLNMAPYIMEEAVKVRTWTCLLSRSEP